MGCDIHLHTEVKINGKWHHYGCPDVERYYAVFAKMANVRNCRKIIPIASPRGIPDDVTELTIFDCENNDGHSHSWLSAEEIVCLEDFIDNDLQLDGHPHYYSWCTKNFGLFFGLTWSSFHKYHNYLPEVEDVRFVFWFDN